ncbi:MAG: restriction endonuclease subunit S [Actinomycetales bacterium]|tara:strand:- start:1369 stop:2496 length:1128 start_codon:yes stop_codon:yes gene_type:complete
MIEDEGSVASHPTLGDFLNFRNGKTSPLRSADAEVEVFGANGAIGKTEKANFDGPTVIIGRVGSYCGSLHYSPDPIWVTDNAIACNPKRPSDAAYWYYALQTLGLNARSSGSGQPLLNHTVLSQIPFSPPSAAERNAIAEVLAALDNKINANSKLADSVSSLAHLLFNRATESIGSRPMSELLDPILGGTPSRVNSDFWGGSHFWASAKDITGAKNAVVIATEESISELAVNNTKAKPLPVGSVILTARGTVGAVARLAVPASFNQSCYGFVPGEIPGSILYFGILNAMQRAKAIAHGSVFDTITMKTFDHLDFPAFERGAADSLNRNIAPLLDTVVAKVKENKTLAELRDTLLPELMSGRLRVNDIESVVTDAV